MNQSLTGLMEVMRGSLRDVVLPELTTDHARSQLAGVLDLLGVLENQLVWSPDTLREQLRAIEQGELRIAARAEEAGCILPVAVMGASPVAPLCQAELEQTVGAGEQRLVALADYLYLTDALPAALPVSLRDELDALLRSTLRETLVAQRRLVPKANFSAMTAASD
jgi:hypothetical protein